MGPTVDSFDRLVLICFELALEEGSFTLAHTAMLSRGNVLTPDPSASNILPPCHGWCNQKALAKRNNMPKHDIASCPCLPAVLEKGKALKHARKQSDAASTTAQQGAR